VTWPRVGRHSGPMLTTDLVVIACTILLFALSVSALVLLPAISVDRSTYR